MIGFMRIPEHRYTYIFHNELCRKRRHDILNYEKNYFDVLKLLCKYINIFYNNIQRPNKSSN